MSEVKELRTDIFLELLPELLDIFRQELGFRPRDRD
jgi:hypothetical protein